MKKICVIGSINMDLVVGVDRFPNPGETLSGTHFTTVPGGKGGNQAVALGKLGAPVAMAGWVGKDAFGEQYLQTFAANAVDHSAVSQSDLPTGVALIEVDGKGENHIVVVSGANDMGDLPWIRSVMDTMLSQCDVFLMQLEIPLPSILYAAQMIRAHGKCLLLDPAPMQTISDEMIELADYITPNEHELKSLTPTLSQDASIKERLHALAKRGAHCIIHKRGGQGSYLYQNDTVQVFPAYKVKAVDTTAAGDSFNAGLAYGLANGMPLTDAILLANAVGALATTKFGAQSGMPTIMEAQALMQQQKTI